MKLIPDLLNIIFDQSDYQIIIELCTLNRRKTVYASKYSILSNYNIFGNHRVKNIESACFRGGLKMVKHLIASGVDPNVITDNYDYMISISAWHANLEQVKFLFDLTTSMNAINKAFVRAAQFGQLDVVKFFVCKRVEFQTDDINILTTGATYGNIPIVKFLIDCGADVHADNENALLWAITMHHLHIAKCLIDAGADVHIGDEEPLRMAIGESEIMMFDGEDDVRMIEYLISVGANIGAIDVEAYSGDMREYLRMLK